MTFDDLDFIALKLLNLLRISRHIANDDKKNC